MRRIMFQQSDGETIATLGAVTDNLGANPTVCPPGLSVDFVLITAATQRTTPEAVSGGFGASSIVYSATERKNILNVASGAAADCIRRFSSQAMFSEKSHSCTASWSTCEASYSNIFDSRAVGRRFDTYWVFLWS